MRIMLYVLYAHNIVPQNYSICINYNSILYIMYTRKISFQSHPRQYSAFSSHIKFIPYDFAHIYWDLTQQIYRWKVSFI